MQNGTYHVIAVYDDMDKTKVDWRNTDHWQGMRVLRYYNITVLWYFYGIMVLWYHGYMYIMTSCTQVSDQLAWLTIAANQ